jgi:hypothetical protein
MLSRRPRDFIRRSFDRRRQRERDVVYGRYASPANPHAEGWVVLPGTTVPIFVGSTVGAVTFRPGSIVPLLSESGAPGLTIAGRPAPGRKGAADFPLAAPTPGGVTPFGIIRAVPGVLVVGEADQPVTIHGFGLVDGDTYRPVKWSMADQNFVLDSAVTVHDVAYVSATEVTMELDVIEGLPWRTHRPTLQPRRSWEG